MIEINSKTYYKSYVDQLGLVSRPEVMEDRGLVEIGEVGHVLTLLKLGRVDLLDLISLEHLLVVSNGDLDLASILRLQHTLDKATFSVRNPKGLLCIISLGHVLPLHLEGEEEVWSWIRILSIISSLLLISRHDDTVMTQ